MRFIPIHVDTQDTTILIIGGGEAAEAKLRTLVKTDARLKLVSDNISDEIRRWVDDRRIDWVERDYNKSDFDGILLVYAATDSADDNDTIAAAARDKGILVNAADQKEACDFYTPAIVDRSPVVVSIGTEGTSPGLARAIKADLETRLPSALGVLAKSIQRLRKMVTAKLPLLSARQAFWAKILSGKDLTQQIKLSPEALEERVVSALNDQDASPNGHVSLVGAGPGDAGLITLAGRQKLHSADVIIYDRLVGKDVLDFGRREAKYIFVGKVPGQPSIKQDEINRMIVEEASQGHFVVRLKGGDPLIFGRADEEIEAIKAVGLSFDIVPGITAAASAAAEIGMSLTARGQNKAVSLLTGHDAKGFAEQDWTALAGENVRAAIYMGVGASRFIQGRLLLHGASGDKPVTVVENASRDNQIIVDTTLANLPQDIEKYGIKGPAILLLGYARDIQSIEQRAAS